MIFLSYRARLFLSGLNLTSGKAKLSIKIFFLSRNTPGFSKVQLKYTSR